MTIHELAACSGVSVRMLHYYDKINLLKPCCVKENGYRVYDEESIKTLQQILFYKEMDLPLKKIKWIMEQEVPVQDAAIKEQIELLIAKRDRYGRLIERMEQMVKGKVSMDFSVFEHNELQEVMKKRMEKLDQEYKDSIIKQYGSLEAFLTRMLEHGDRIKESAEQYYGSFENYIKSLEQDPLPAEGTGKLQVHLDSIVKQIGACKTLNISDPMVQNLVEEWKETAMKLFQMDDITEVYRNLYHGYQTSPEIIRVMDQTFGEGTCVYLGKAMEFNDKNKKNMV